MATFDPDEKEAYFLGLPHIPPPAAWSHTPPANKPVEPDVSGLTEEELAEFLVWKPTRDSTYAFTNPGAGTAATAFLAFLKQEKVWNAISHTDRIVQYRWHLAERSVANKATLPRAVSTSTDPTVILPAGLPPHALEP